MRREVYILPWSTFPASFRADADAFLERLSGRDLSDDGPLRPAGEVTLKTRSYQLRRIASALVHRGVPPERIAGLADLVVLENYQSALRFFLDRREGKTSPQVGQLAAFLKDVARHWVKVDEATLTKIQKVASRLAVSRRGMTPKNRERLRPLDDAAKVSLFLSTPERIQKKVERDTRSPRLMAIEAQTAAAIAILQAAPIRLKNLAALDLGNNLVSRGKRLYLVIEDADVKNNETIDFELPPKTVDIVAWYVREHRPNLLKGPSQALFPGENGAAKQPGTLAPQIARTFLRYTGMAFNTHLFRHAGGKIFLDARPGQYEVMRRVLGCGRMLANCRRWATARPRSWRACKNLAKSPKSWGQH